jgi:hypothetical protein
VYVCMYVCIYIYIYVQVHDVYDNLRRLSDLVLDDRQQSVAPVLMPYTCVSAFQFTVLPSVLGFFHSPCLSKALEVFSFEPLGAPFTCST